MVWQARTECRVVREPEESQELKESLVLLVDPVPMVLLVTKETKDPLVILDPWVKKVLRVQGESREVQEGLVMTDLLERRAGAE